MSPDRTTVTPNHTFQRHRPPASLAGTLAASPLGGRSTWTLGTNTETSDSQDSKGESIY